ncbi:MAG: hypothetical protein P8J01_03015 [Acidimicrobiales bacterium]|nr:hypothetical protein [Acidimicrobiales bacterium]
MKTCNRWLHIPIPSMQLTEDFHYFIVSGLVVGMMLELVETIGGHSMSGRSSTFKKIRSIELKYVVASIALVVLFLFIFQNTDDVQIEFLWLDMNIPLFLLLLLTTALTWLATILALQLNKRGSGAQAPPNS